jgi:vacuolar-type H+-ATPase subunit I/STV1
MILIIQLIINYSTNYYLFIYILYKQMATLRDEYNNLQVKRQAVLDAVAGVDENITNVKDKAINNKNLIQSIPPILGQINDLIDIIETLITNEDDVDNRIATLTQEKDDLREEIDRLQRPEQQDAATSPEGPGQDQGTSPMRRDDGSPSPIRRDQGTSPRRDDDLEQLRDAYRACNAQLDLLRTEKEELTKIVNDIIKTTDEAYNTILNAINNIVARLKEVGDEDLAIPELQNIMTEVNNIYTRLTALVPAARRPPAAGGGKKRKSRRKKNSRTRKSRKSRRSRKSKTRRKKKGGYRYKQKKGKSSRRKKGRSQKRSSNFLTLLRL